MSSSLATARTTSLLSWNPNPWAVGPFPKWVCIFRIRMIIIGPVATLCLHNIHIVTRSLVVYSCRWLPGNSPRSLRGCLVCHARQERLVSKTRRSCKVIGVDFVILCAIAACIYKIRGQGLKEPLLLILHPPHDRRRWTLNREGLPIILPRIRPLASR